MREILFRGKDVDTGIWVYGYYSGPVGACECHEICDINDVIGSMVDVDPDTVGQYTGLTDKNGTKIFEGDIIGYKDGRFVANCIVNFGLYAAAGRIGKSHMGFYLDWAENDLLRNDIGFWASERLIEVIGNIYDNPELIGGTE
jgi:hypothetical protein